MELALKELALNEKNAMENLALEQEEWKGQSALKAALLHNGDLGASWVHNMFDESL